LDVWKKERLTTKLAKQRDQILGCPAEDVVFIVEFPDSANGEEV
jgi:hypothetical protein